MPDVKLLDTSNSAPTTPTASPSPTPVEPKTISFQLEGEPGEAVFSIPTIRHLKQAERGNPSPQDLCRKLGEICLIKWGEQTKIPDDDAIDAVDDQEMMQVFLDLIEDTTSGEYEVLPDRSHRVQLSVGSLTLRRLTRKDVKLAETSKAGRVAIDILTAVSATTDWWRSDRSIMPADFDPLPLSDYGRLSKALQGFLTKRASAD
jgi:hypothetical protein